MKLTLKSIAWTLALVGFVVLGASQTRADDESQIIFEPDFLSAPAPDASAIDTAREILKQWSTRLGLSPELSELSAPTVQESLLGTHVRFSQIIKGAPVGDAEVIVSIARTAEGEPKKILKIFSSLILAPVDSSQIKSGPVVSTADAIDRAWNHLRVHGDLLRPIQTRFTWAPFQGRLVPSVEVAIQTTAPAGDWVVRIHSITGQVLSERNLQIDEKKPGVPALSIESYTGAIASRQEAELNLRRTILKRAQNKALLGLPDGETDPIRADGTAFVFDPDPLSTLKRLDLADGTAAAEFEPAYQVRVLKDLTVAADGRYHLIGPWVQLDDAELPRVPPSVTTDGNWTAKRGEDAFDDAIVYFHLDQSQRYMQGLGFIGAKGIQHGSIHVDANGVGGDDNSHFSPMSNSLAFGHGCVNDSEDADVILHEYGHAINFSINKSWTGGDTGAMGEGFGDYWAGSYSLAATGESDFNLGKVFDWDGIDACWPGRRLDRINAKYDPRRTYGAHANVGGYQSDELWSTPLFQSLLELRKLGITREEVDQIILEAQFGLGSGVRMPQMARSILATARKLYPEGPHRSVLLQKFAQVGILPANEPEL